jgi:hypothetical protein
MSTLQDVSLVSSKIFERVAIPVDLAVVCLLPVVGLLLTMQFLALGLEIGQALAIAG